MRFKQLDMAQLLILFVLLTMCGSTDAAGMTNEVQDVSASYTSGDVAMLLTYVLLALVFSFLCSVAEAVLLSITPSYIAGLQDNRPRLAALLKRLKQDNVDQSLAAILTLNTIAHTVGAIGSGSKATVVFGSAWFGLFSAVMTLLILFLSEIVPKTIGAVYWRKLAGVTALFVKTLIFILYPLIRISEGLTRLISHGRHVQVFNRDEFVAMAHLGEQAGHLAEDESRIIRNLFRFESLKAEDVMTPRTVVSALSEEISVEEGLGLCGEKPFSRIPLYRKNLDEVTGFALKSDLLLSKAEGQESRKLTELKRNLSAVSGDITLSNLLELLLDNRQHMVVVVNEYGGTRGIVTLEDVVETLLGTEIVDELDKVEDMQAYARQRWAERAKARGLDIEHSLKENID